MRLICAVFVLAMLPLPAAGESVEPFWGAQEFYTQKGHLRYLLLMPPHYDPRQTYELWINMHGCPGCAGHAIIQYRDDAQQRQVFLLAPQATGEAGATYVRPDGKKDVYRCWYMHKDQDHILAVLEEVMRKYAIDRDRIALLGFSAGCEMGWRLLAARPETFYFFGGVANGFQRGKPPAAEAALRRAARHVPHFYAAGRDDDFAGPMFRPTARRLRAYGFELRTAYPAGVGHALPPSIKTPLLAFMDAVRARHPRVRKIPGGAAPPRRSRSRNRGLLWAGAAVGVAALLLGIGAWRVRRPSVR